MNGLKIPYEVADGIALAVMQDSLSYLTEELRAHKEDGSWMHPEDVYNSETKYIPALKTLIAYYGGTHE